MTDSIMERTTFYPDNIYRRPERILVEKFPKNGRVIDLGGIVTKTEGGVTYQKVVGGWLQCNTPGQYYIDPVIYQ